MPRNFIFFVFFFLAIFFVNAQDSYVKIVPEEIRYIPEDFKENYESVDYNYQEKTSIISDLKNLIVEFLIRIFSLPKSEANIDLNYFFKFLGYFVIGFTIFIVLRLVLRKEGRWIFKKNADEIDPDAAIHEDIKSVNFKELITSAEAQKNYREAVKYRYFYLLKKLDDANVLSFDPQKTTYDYQLELEDTKYNAPFNKAAYYYTYIWYGEFSVDDQEYQTTSNVFNQLIHSI